MEKWEIKKEMLCVTTRPNGSNFVPVTKAVHKK